MKNFKKTLCGLLFGLAGFGAVAATVSDVTARQRYPWNGKIDIDYTVTGADTTNTALAVTLTDHDTGKVYSLTENGRNQFTWNKTDLVVSNVTATVSLVSYNTPKETKDLYCVIDLSKGPDAPQWPVAYLYTPVPSDGWSNEYKTTKLVLRYIPAGTFIMGDGLSDQRRRVTLTKPFYIGVFEVTQKQWNLVQGVRPVPSSSDETPAYNVSYNNIRGASSGARWPVSSTVDASSFLGKLRAKTGLDFDLPTEAQWEYACRAGTTTVYYWGDEKDDVYAWYCDDINWWAHISSVKWVGQKWPNDWGLYDMSGNVWEWCRDWWDESLVYGTDPVGSASGLSRVVRGGSWHIGSDYCTSSYRYNVDPSFRSDAIGFRLVRILPD